MNNGNDGKILTTPPKKMNAVMCPCAEIAPLYDNKGKSYTVCVDTQRVDGSAQIKLLVCNSCGHMVEVSEDALVGHKKKIYVDAGGLKHHRLKCDTLPLGAKGGDLK